MSTVLCPNGHASTATDYCDVCGEPITAAATGTTGSGSGSAARTPAADPLAAPTPSSCPHCGAPAAPHALFCESCGYDFTTGVLPTPDPLDLSTPTPTPSPPAGFGDVSAAQDPGTVTKPGEGGVVGTADPNGLALAPGDEPWVVELWIDPDWYAAQSPEDPLPSVGLPTVVPLRLRSVLVGRPSRSRGITPQVDCGTDAGVSRRHCQLTTDGQRWWVEDLQSANGTYVAAPGAAMPTDPLTPGERHELADGDRLYLGGWTRLVVRRALPGEA